MAADAPRPPRRPIPVRIKRAVCERQGGICKCGCGMQVSCKPRTGTKFDHRPPLRLRDVSADGKDYEPHQHSAEHIDAVCKAEHDRRTYRGGRGARSDATSIARERRREKRAYTKPAPLVSKWKGRGIGKRPAGAGSGFPPRGSTPMRKPTPKPRKDFP